MVTLVDILRNAAVAGKIEDLSMHVQIETDLESLEKSINLAYDGRKNEQETRRFAYIKGLEGFRIGFADEENNAASNSNSDNQYFILGYGHGFERGSLAREKIKRFGEKDIFGLGYSTYSDQLKWTVDRLVEETERLIEVPTKEAFELFQKELVGTKDNLQLRSNLAEIFQSYSDFAQRVLSTAYFDAPFIHEIERKAHKNFDDFAKLGIVYLFRRDIKNAESSFAGSRKRVDRLLSPFSRVSDMIPDAVEVIQQVYDKLPKHLEMPYQ